ncbi:FIST C-terminal domain-containing protein [Pseudenhygromyxa sp. WMMC2535]|uniref:FIST N-terminal domain-containing protein n=1 Tax=Pseudenhygromyxa sp. WMMC2535 TaxID=2712867 RepID=UPI0015517777|nr:FIST C-terminal domain-containing protein [Pseudenhygromyxa sp. WMMC2535]
MRWASAISDADDLEVAIEQSTDELQSQLEGDAPDLLLVFVSRDHQHRWHELPALLRDRFPSATVLGCTAGGVIGDGHELEEGPGLALTAARLPGVELTAFHIPSERTPDPEPDPAADPRAERERWLRAIGIPDGPDPHLILLPDPFTWSGPELLASLDRAFPGGAKIGGLVSGGRRPGEHRMFCERSCHHRGMVGLAMRGNIEVDTIVAQGCRPVGTPLFATRRQGNVIYELDGRASVEVLQQLLDELPPEDRALAHSSLFIGVSMTTEREVYDQGDFLVRNLVGVDPTSGAIGVAAELQGNPVVQFHVRDAETSANELRELLADYAYDRRAERPQVALLFSCLGRGEVLYGEPDHDSNAIRELLDPGLPIAGFFCNAEIGPISGHTFMHGYTSAIMLVRPATVI